MKVKDFIKELQQLDQEAIIILSKDSEGNSYSPYDGYWEGSYAAETTWYGNAGIKELTKELKKTGHTKEDVVSGESAVILCPVN